MINRLFRSGYIQKYSLSSLKVIISGGAPIKSEVQKELRRILPHVQISQSYGKYSYGAIK